MCKAEARELGCSLQRAFGGSQGSAAVSPAVSLYVGMRDSTAVPCPCLWDGCWGAAVVLNGALQPRPAAAGVAASHSSKVPTSWLWC